MKFIILVSLLFASSYSSPFCPTGFTLVNNKCLRLLENYYIKHLEAETDCRQFGGTLVTIHNAIDNRAVASFAGNKLVPYMWIGVFCFGNSTDSCYLDDGSGPLKYHNFAVGNPKVDSDHGSCVYSPAWGSDMGKWYSGPCEWTGLAAVCQVPPTLEEPSCPHNYNGHCYVPHHLLDIPFTNRTISEAQGVCQKHSMDLVSIHSIRELDFIKSIYANSTITELTLGARASNGSSFEWTDGTHFDYENFDPFFDIVDGDCVKMDLSVRPDNGMWIKTSCSVVGNFMCKSRVVGEPLTPELSQHLDLSNSCNSTLYLAPGTITSLDSDSGYCTWKVAVLVPYRLGLYFTDFFSLNPVNVYSSNGTLLANVTVEQSVLAPSNIVTLTHDSSNHGFKAVILPY